MTEHSWFSHLAASFPHWFPPLPRTVFSSPNALTVPAVHPSSPKGRPRERLRSQPDCSFLLVTAVVGRVRGSRGPLLACMIATSTVPDQRQEAFGVGLDLIEESPGNGGGAANSALP